MAQVGTPVPLGWPTRESYTDSSGNGWAWTATGGWQITGNAASGDASNWASSITSWLQESKIVTGIPNFWLVGGVDVLALLFSDLGGRKRRCPP
jgi:hypothetical protein